MSTLPASATKIEQALGLLNTQREMIDAQAETIAAQADTIGELQTRLNDGISKIAEIDRKVDSLQLKALRILDQQ